MRGNEGQAIGRGVEAQGVSIAGRERRRQVICRPAALADKLEAARHRPDLVLEERSRVGFDDHLVAMTGD